LVNSGFLREKEMDLWRAATGDPYLMEKNLDEIPMFAQCVERGLALPASDFFKGVLRYYMVLSTSISTQMGSSTFSSSSTSVRRLWVSSPTGSCSANSSG
jgi:hypothetical protein